MMGAHSIRGRAIIDSGPQIRELTQVYLRRIADEPVIVDSGSDDTHVQSFQQCQIKGHLGGFVRDEIRRGNPDTLSGRIQYGCEEQTCRFQFIRRTGTEYQHIRCQPWRAKRRLVDPSSREAALFSRRALRQRENKVGLRTRRPVIWESSTEQQRACEVVA